MTAWVIDEAFGLDQLRRVDRPPAEPGPGEVRLRVRAVSLNYRDLMMVQGRYNPRQPLPLVPCSDAACTVEAVGDGVTRVAVGERVCPIFAQGWIAGRPHDDLLRTTLGGPLDGTLQRHLVVPAEAVVRPPDHLTDAEAATLGCAGVTAWRALVTEGGITAGDTVLTLGTGGVSLFAVQIGRMLGARVIVTSSSDAKLARARALGAVDGLRYDEEPAWGKRVMERTHGRGVDLVVELGGAGTLDQSLRAVRPGGTIALIGVLAGSQTPVALPRVFMRGLRLQGIVVGNREDFEALCRALEAHPDVRPEVHRTFGFDQAPEALRYLSEQRHLGKIVLEGA